MIDDISVSPVITPFPFWSLKPLFTLFSTYISVVIQLFLFDFHLHFQNILTQIEKYIVDIVFATRYPEKYGLKELKDMIGFGGSPRASINLALAARSYAFIKRRGYVIPEDVRAVAHDVLRHRIGLTYEAEASNITADEIISKILNKVEVP